MNYANEKEKKNLLVVENGEKNDHKSRKCKECNIKSQRKEEEEVQIQIKSKRDMRRSCRSCVLPCRRCTRCPLLQSTARLAEKHNKKTLWAPEFISHVNSTSLTHSQYSDLNTELCVTFHPLNSHSIFPFFFLFTTKHLNVGMKWD